MIYSSNTLLLAFTFAIVLSSSLVNASPKKGHFKKWRCQYDCMTDFDMCVSAIKSIEEYIICHNAQGICKWHCLYSKKKGHAQTAGKLKAAALKSGDDNGEKPKNEKQQSKPDSSTPLNSMKKVIPTKKNT